MIAELLILKGAVSELEESDQVDIKAIAANIRKIVDDNGDNGILAVALVMGEVASEESE